MNAYFLLKFICDTCSLVHGVQSCIGDAGNGWNGSALRCWIIHIGKLKHFRKKYLIKKPLLKITKICCIVCNSFRTTTGAKGHHPSNTHGPTTTRHFIKLSHDQPLQRLGLTSIRTTCCAAPQFVILFRNALTPT